MRKFITNIFFGLLGIVGFILVVVGLVDLIFYSLLNVNETTLTAFLLGKDINPIVMLVLGILILNKGKMSF